MSPTADIQIGPRSIGTIALDLAQVRGEGGPHDPRLVLPLVLTFATADLPRPLVVSALTCALHVGYPAFPHNQYGGIVPVGLPREGLYYATSPRPEVVEVRIPLSLAALIDIERGRHTTADKTFVGTLRFTASVAWVVQSYNAVHSLGTPSSTPIEQAPFDYNMGPSALLVPFDTTRVADLTVQVPHVTWVDRVLPGLGFAHLRLVELALPHADGPLPAQVVADFDAARHDYDTGRYRESVQKSRDIRSAVEAHFQALDTAYTGQEKGAKYLYNIVKRLLSLTDTDPQYVFLRDTWNAWVALSSAGHHTRDYTAADARACLYQAAVLLEYVTGLLSPPPLGLARTTGSTTRGATS